MATPESSCCKTGRLEHPTPEDAEENNFKYNFIKMIKTLKEEI